MKILIENILSILCYFLCLRPKHSPQHCVLEHPQPMLTLW